MGSPITRRYEFLFTLAFLGIFRIFPANASAPAPIKIGFTQPLSGNLRSNGKGILLALKIWAKDVNAKGGLLGRPIDLVYYDDHGNPTEIRSLYEKLINVDHVDFILGSYGTPAATQILPVAKRHKMVLPGMFAVDANRDINHRYYFSAGPFGPTPYVQFSNGFFKVAAEQYPRPKTVVLIATSNDYGQEAIRGAAKNATEMGFQVLDSRIYPSDKKDFNALMRDVKAENPDIVYVASFPPDSVGIIKAAKEANLKPKMFGGGMVGLQYTDIQTSLGPLLNGVITFCHGTPIFFKRFPLVPRLLKEFQNMAKTDPDTDPLGTFMAPYAYAYAQFLEVAIRATGSLDQTKVGEYLATHEISTIVGNIRFAPNGEWDHSRLLQIQFQGIEGHNVGQFAEVKKPTMSILYPPQFATGKIVYPFPGWD